MIKEVKEKTPVDIDTAPVRSGRLAERWPASDPRRNDVNEVFRAAELQDPETYCLRADMRFPD